MRKWDRALLGLILALSCLSALEAQQLSLVMNGMSYRIVAGRDGAEPLSLRDQRGPAAPAEIEQDRQQALQVASASDLDVRQQARWRNLAGELSRRAKLANAMLKENVPAK